MSDRRMRFIPRFVFAAVVMAIPTARAIAQSGAIDWSRVDAAFGRTGTPQDGGVRRYSMPRTDLDVMVGGVKLRPAFALGSWLAMLPTAHGVLAMGDLVLREDELNPVISKLQDGGVEQSAVHHHVIRESPRILYVHIHGHGDPVAVAAAVKAALALTATPAPAAGPAPAPPAIAFDTAQVTSILGANGKNNGGVWQVSIPRLEPLKDGDVVLPASMGVATAINLQPTGNGRAVATGDFVMLGSEVNAVIRALRKGGIEVTSLHNHLLTDEPRLFFMHFWGDGDAVTVARALKAGVDATRRR